VASHLRTQFATSRPYHLTSLSLVNMRQEKGESYVPLWSNLARSLLTSGIWFLKWFSPHG